MSEWNKTVINKTYSDVPLSQDIGQYDILDKRKAPFSLTLLSRLHRQSNFYYSLELPNRNIVQQFHCFRLYIEMFILHSFKYTNV